MTAIIDSGGAAFGARFETAAECSDGQLTAKGLSVVICSLNGADGVARCLKALSKQTVSSSIEVIVVDDGSTDGTSDVARAHGAIVVRHITNRGPAAARNTGVRHATCPVVAFLDDDCEPSPGWAEHILSAYRGDVVGVGGAIVPQPGSEFILGYLRRHNPLQPLELALAESPSLGYRLWLYLKGLWTTKDRDMVRAVYAVPSANMSFLRNTFNDLGGFDDRFKFGGEDTDLCMRVGQALPQCRLVFVPEAVATHHFDSTLRDTLRRSQAYGEGAARLYHKWPAVLPAVFPGPLGVLALLLLGAWLPWLLIAAVAAPQLLYPHGIGHALRDHSLASLLDPYVQLAQEASVTAGFALSWWPTRHVFSARRMSEDG